MYRAFSIEYESCKRAQSPEGLDYPMVSKRSKEALKKGISVKGLGQKGESASESPRDIQSLFYGATMGDPNADLFQVISDFHVGFLK